MSWDDIDRLITAADFNAKFDDDMPFLVVLIRPADNLRLKCYASVITRTVMRLLWKAHGLRLKRRAKELFQVFQTHRDMGPSAGWLFEAMVHDMLEAGINVPMDPMIFEENRRANALNDKYLTSKVGTGRWKSSPMTYVPFTQNDCALQLETSRYYVPVDENNPTHDSFTFEVVPCSFYKGPILNPNDKTPHNKTALNVVSIKFSRRMMCILKARGTIIQKFDIGLFTVFQATKATEHDINERCLNYIFVIAKHCQLKAIGIRYIGIVPTREQQTFKAPVAWRGKLDMYTLPIAIYDPEGLTDKQPITPVPPLLAVES